MEDQEEVKSDLYEEIRQTFNLFDKNNDGSIDVKELGDGLRALGNNPTDAEVEQMMRDADSKVNPNGKLEFNEFYDLMTANLKSFDEEESSLMEAFKNFDKNGNGSIDKEELREALMNMGFSKLTNDEVDELFAEADTDNSGSIDYRELVAVLTNSKEKVKE